MGHDGLPGFFTRLETLVSVLKEVRRRNAVDSVGREPRDRGRASLLRVIWRDGPLGPAAINPAGGESAACTLTRLAVENGDELNVSCC